MQSKMFTFIRSTLLILLLITITGQVFPVLAQPDTKSIDSYISKARKDWDIPGMAVAVVKNDEIILAKGYGKLQIDQNRSVDANTMFAIASNTKAFVSASLAILVDEKKISWDDKVIDHLPNFRLYDSYATQNATIRDLLCHRIGLGTYSGDVIWYKSELTSKELLDKIGHVPPAYSFRSGYGYSNLMFITAGELIQSVTGQSWDIFLREKILDPLQMNRTVTSIEKLNELDNIATPHKPIYGNDQPIAYTNWDIMGAAGGILSNINDMARWMILHLNEGMNQGETIFTRDVQIDMWTPHNNYRLDQNSRDFIPSRHFSGYGLGWGLSDYKGRMMVTHGGGYDGMYSKVTMIPDENIGIVVLTNSMKGVSTPLTLWIIDAMLGQTDRDWSMEYREITKKDEAYKKQRVQKRKDARISGTTPSVDLSLFVGRYFDPMYGFAIVILKDGQLNLNFPTAPLLNAKLTHWHYNTYQIIWDNTHAWFDFGTVQFSMDNNNQVTGLMFDVPNDDIFFHELNMKKMD